MVDGVLATLIKSFVLVNILMVFFAFMTCVERKLIGRFQARYGPNRVGPYGLLQPIADLGKMLQKENMIPTGAKPKLYLMAPWIAMACALGAFGLMPFGNVATIPGTDYTFHLYIADTSVSLLVVAAIGSLGFYGLMIGGLASSSKYALLGGMRAIAQLVSYEVAFTLAVIGVIIQAGSLSFVTISNAQDNLWYVIPQILGFLVFFVAAVAESNRPPFDLTEAEGEVVAGYHTEYGGMRYAMFAAAEFVNAITLSALGAVLLRWTERSVPAGTDMDADQDRRVPVRPHLDPCHAAACALRSVDEAGLEGPAARGHPQLAADRGNCRVPLGG